MPHYCTSSMCFVSFCIVWLLITNSIYLFGCFLADASDVPSGQVWDLPKGASTLISRAGYVLNLREGWDPLTLGQDVTIEIERVIGINEETKRVEDQDRSNFDAEQIWTVTPLEMDDQYKFSIGDKFLTSNGDTLSTMGNILNHINHMWKYGAKRYGVVCKLR